MPYDQVEAKLRFDGLLGLWERLHEKVVGKKLTLGEYTDLHQEGKHLMDAYNDEMDRYMKTFGHEQVYEPAIGVIVRIQKLAICTGGHLVQAKERLDDAERGKVVFNEMLGTPPAPKNKIWN